MSKTRSEAEWRRTARLAAATAAVLTAALLSACSSDEHRQVALATPEAVASPTARIPVKTVRHLASTEDDASRLSSSGGIPSPNEIFDFHPTGRSDSWRTPFVIDTNDGPLAADVRRSSAELKAYMAGLKADPKTGTRRCGETDIANKTPGCTVPPGAKQASAAPKS